MNQFQFKFLKIAIAKKDPNHDFKAKSEMKI